MNHYEAKQEARRQRYLERADRAESEASARARRASEMGDCIPMGQPVLVGHHSEKRDRAFRKRIDTNMRKSVEASDKAGYYRGRAASVGSAGVSSDDPDAITKLRAELETREQDQAMMKAVNRVIRKYTRKGEEVPVDELVAAGLSEPAARATLEPDFAGRVGFPSYALQNNNANIRRYRQRIEELQAAAERESETIEGDGYTCMLDADDNRVVFEFPGKPDSATRDILKRAGFKWSRYRMAWVRKATGNGIAAGRSVMTQLDQRET